MSITIQIDGSENIIVKAITLLKTMPGLKVQAQKANIVLNEKKPTSRLLRSINEGKSGKVTRCKSMDELIKSLDS